MTAAIPHFKNKHCQNSGDSNTLMVIESLVLVSSSAGAAVVLTTQDTSFRKLVHQTRGQSCMLQSLSVLILRIALLCIAVCFD